MILPFTNYEKGERCEKKFIREEILKKLAEVGDKGLTIYDASMAGPDRSDTVSTSTATKILDDFRVRGLVFRKEEEFRRAKPYVITQEGRDVLKVAKTVSDLRKSGKTVTIGQLVTDFGAENVNLTMLACLLRYRVPSVLQCEAVIA
jgi:DNA-binding PadR family transcriptional regulator